MKTIPLHQIVLAHVITTFTIRAVMLIVVGFVIIVQGKTSLGFFVDLSTTLLFTAIATFLSAKRILKKYEIPNGRYVVNNSTFLFVFAAALFYVANAIINGFNFENFLITLTSVFFGAVGFYLVSRSLILSHGANT